MTWLGRMIGREARDRVDPKHPRDPVLADWFGGGADAANVTPDSAMRVTAVYACVSLIAEMMAALPLHVYRREGDGGAVTMAKAKTHPLYEILHEQPAPGLTSFEWREAMVTHTCLRGDSFARIVTDGAGRVTALPMLPPTLVRPYLSDKGAVWYDYTPASGRRQLLRDDEVLRIPHKMLDGVTSMSPIQTHRATIGTSMQAANYLNRFYANNAAPKGGLKVPGALSPEATAALRKSWTERHAGPENVGRLAIFDGGMEWQEVGMNMADAQWIETQQFSIQDIARIYLVPPHKIGDLSKATFSNIEHQAIQFVVDTLDRWRKRIRARLNLYLLSPADRRAGYYIDFDLKGLLAGDSAARAKFYQALFYVGAISPNEIRALEDMNPYEGGDRRFIQGASVPVDRIDDALDRAASSVSPPGNLEDNDNAET